MHPKGAIVAVVALALAAALAAGRAQAQSIDTKATHAVILDFETGLVLFDKNGDEPMPPASMSKIMTALMTFERIKDGFIALEDEVRVSTDAWRRGGAATGGSTMFLEVNSRVSVENLLRGVIVQSGNDASIALAEAIGGSEAEFAAQMTERARELGIENATFRNATGLPDPEHRISARALAEIARTIIRDHPELYAMYSERAFTWNNIPQSNRNPLLGNFAGADGLKTGHTEESGYGLVASAERDGVRRIVVFNGLESASDRATEAERLMRAAFSDFRIHPLFARGDTVGRAPVFLGAEASVPVAVDADVTLAYNRRAAREAAVEIVYQAPLKAPVAAGDPIGEVVIAVPGSPEVRAPAVAAGSVERLGLVQRVTAAAVHLIRTADDG
ncbi:MAG: D-alanyl-D-alanine carboxypeptidase [Caulobacterales bacterium]|nr:D-alanyl-D-alanine carboxypeptidase [Caulobacterales bacterium]